MHPKYKKLKDEIDCIEINAENLIQKSEKLRDKLDNISKPYSKQEMLNILKEEIEKRIKIHLTKNKKRSMADKMSNLASDILKLFDGNLSDDIPPFAVYPIVTKEDILDAKENCVSYFNGKIDIGGHLSEIIKVK